MTKIFIAAGGTGGHIFPALAVADALSKRGVDVQWLGSRGRLEERLVPAAHYPITYLPISALRGKSWKARLLFPWRMLLSTAKTFWILRRQKADLILGMGGYVCGPAGLGAYLARKPFVLHEQNAVLGFTNAQLARWSAACLQAFPATFAPRFAAQVVGNPVREAIAALPPPEVRWQQRAANRRLRVLVLGGSQGAHFINNCIPALAASAPALIAHVEWWHQTGLKEEADCAKRYQQAGVTAKVCSFIEDMACAYAWADLVIARAGALTVSEISAVGVACLFIPFPQAVDDHQWQNCQPLCRAGAALALREAEVNVAVLRDILVPFLQTPERLLKMAMAARQQRAESATQQIVERCIQIISKCPTGKF